MNPVLQCIVIAAAVSVLMIAILLQMQREPKQERFQDYAQVQTLSLGLSGGVLAIVILFALFFMYFYRFPKQPNVISRRITYYNLE